MRAGELCSREVIVIEPTESVVAAAKLMAEQHVGCLVVVRRDAMSCSPLGIVTDRDIALRVVASQPARTAQLSVHDIMTPEPLVTLDTADLSDVLKQMRNRGVRRVPVVDERNQLLGLLAYDDVVEWVSEEMWDLARLVGRERNHERTRAKDQTS